MRAKALLYLFTFAALSASASSVYNFSAAPTSADPKNLSFGFEFYTKDAITVSSLGYFDQSGTGFATSHSVGIFDDSGTLLASTMLDTGADGTLEGQFRFKSIQPVLLDAGQCYIIAGTSGGPSDPWAYGDASSTLENFSMDSRISIAQDASVFWYQEDDILRDPSDHFGYTLYAGPSFEIAATPTPEPATVYLMMGSAMMLAIFAVVRRRSSKRT